ncbi:class I SAM-dependent methyltransferase [Poritiphilus flavus]|uniref:Methyltransferase domain-containing protein n=1 Tax=Poritiphilus flavus TaxID=2697053 RepID=A0A6L9EHW3_9FLAO|nr:methyltransferase domain-containing protein [Poritiphilus flavus]NAS14273.1 methyltransferase domain-containing protein [Poritiphilus flavus]
MAEDILGDAIWDYHSGNYDQKVVIHSSLDEQDILPIPYLFRDYKAMPVLEQKALELCKGSVLDIGCGAGSHSLYLQEKGLDVTALDRSAKAISICSMRGVKKTVHEAILDFSGTKFDTLLLLMNGIGLAGRLEDLDEVLVHLGSLLKAGGQILLDSSDIIYMYESDDDGGYWIPDAEGYYGEMTFQMEYKGNKSETYNWLYIDYNTLQRAANANNLSCELVSNGEHYDYLARLCPLV